MLLRVLGPLELGPPDAPVELPAMQRRLLAVLAVNARRVVSTDALIDALWGEAPPTSAAASLQSHVSRLRGRLAELDGAITLERRDPGYRLDLPPELIDAGRFEALVGDARAQALAGDHRGAAERYAAAAELWRGPALADVADDDFARPEAARLDELRLLAMEERADALLAAGDAATVAAELESAVARQPLRERLQRQLMLARYRMGRTAAALAGYRAYRDLLADELGLEPSVELRELERDILAQAPHLQPVGVTADPASPPASAPPPEPTPAVAPPERKVVTVLVARVAADAPDPEALVEAVEPALTAVRGAVTRFGGTIQQVSGATLTGLFGAPIALEDHAVRAAAAALAALVDTAECAGVEVTAVLHAGEVLLRPVTTDLGQTVDVVGDVVAETAGLVAAAPPGIVVASEAVLRLAGGRLDSVARGDGTHEIRRAGTRTPFEARTLRGLTGFAGRATELAILRDRRDQATAGDGQVVALVGEAGVGKSRLAAEFRGEIDDRWVALHAAATPTDLRTPYLALLGLLRSWAGIADDCDDPDLVAGSLGRLLADLPDAVVPLTALVSGEVADATWQAQEPADRRRRTIGALVDVVLEQATRGPVLLVAEDLHWVDSETHAVLDALVDAVATAPVLLLVTYRPEHLPSWGNRSHVTTLQLAPLRAREADAFLDALLGTDPTLTDLKRHLLEWTGGSPLFCEETVTALAEAGVLAGGPGDYRLVGQLEGFGVPASVHAVLAARIDRLPPSRKSLLQTAAVLGTEGAIDLLIDCVDADEDLVREDLRALRAAEFLFERRGGVEPTFTFKHAITHDAVYASLPRSRRRELHARAAAAIRARGGDRAPEQVGRLGLHHLRAEDWDEAAALLRLAGEQALDRSAHREAAELLERAVEALEHLPETPERIEAELETRIALRPALVPFGQLSRALAHLRRAEELARRTGDRERLVMLHVHQSFSHDLAGEIPEAEAVSLAAIELADELGDPVLQAEARLALAQAYAFAGLGPKVLPTLDPVRAVLSGALALERHGMTGIRGVWAAGNPGLALGMMGEFAAAVVWADEATAMAERGGRIVDRSFAHLVHGVIAYERGAAMAARDHFEAGAAIAADEVPMARLWSESWLVAALAQTGNPERAAILAADVVAAARRAETRLVEVWARQGVAQLALSEGRARDALAETGEILEIAPRHRLAHVEARARRFRAQALGALGDLAGAEQELDAALRVTRQISARPEEAHVLAVRAALLASVPGRGEDAAADAVAADDLYDSLGMSGVRPR